MCDNRCFEVVLVKGPFARWDHKHLFLPHEEGCRLRDQTDYGSPLGLLERLIDPWAIRPKLQRLFDFRHDSEDPRGAGAMTTRYGLAASAGSGRDRIELLICEPGGRRSKETT